MSKLNESVLVLKYQPTTDEELTCIACGLDNCDMEVVIPYPGRRTWVGIHSKCSDILNKRVADDRS